MKSTYRALATGATALVATGAMLVGGAGVAFAATPPYEPDTTNQFGTLMFYDAAGNQVTSGSINDDPFSKYVVASTDDPITANTSATLYGYLPKNGVAPGAWSGEQLSGTTSFPVASPAYIAGAGTHRPVVTNVTGDNTLATLQSDFPNTATDSYQGLYQLRVKTPGNTKWWAADIQITGTSWTQVYPTVASTTTSLSTTAANPQTVIPAGSTPSSITLNSTGTSGVPGSVQFFRNGVALGSPVAVSGGTASTTDVPDGPTVSGPPVTTTYTATFIPAPGVPDSGSSSAPLAYVVQNKAGDVTTTSLAVSQTGFTGDDVNLSSHVADTTTPASTPVGSVSWYDGGSSTPLNASPVSVDGSGNAVFDMPTGFATAGSHSIVAKFAPTDPTAFAASQSAPSNFQQIDKSSPCADPASQCTDNQAFKVTVNAGTLVISTPYTGVDAAHTFDLGTMALDPTGTFLHTSAPFGQASAPGGGVTITDTRAGDLPWNATVAANDFVSGANKINAQNLGFIGVTPSYIAGNALNAGTKPVVVHQLPNQGSAVIYGPNDAGANGISGSGGATHSFAQAAHGDGSVYVFGTMDLYAPTSTPAGTYTTTVTFTIG